MDIKKETKLKIYHKRHGVFLGIAERDFNTEKDEFYPITLDQEDLYGANTHCQKWDSVPCRNTLCKIEIIEEVDYENIKK